MRGGDLGEDIKRSFENAFDPKKNGLEESIRKSNEVLANTFDPNKNGLAAAVNRGVEAIKNVDWNKVGNEIGDGLNPQKNGVSAAFEKFGGDAKRAFEDLGQKIKESAARDKAVLDRAFAPLANEFNNPNSALTKFVRSAGIPITADEWKKKFEDPETYFTLMSFLVTAAASVVTAGAAGPGTFAAMQTVIAGARVITKAAMGQPVGAGDIAGIVMAMVPGTGGTDPSSWMGAATAIGSSVGGNLLKAAAKNVVTTNVADRMKQNGESLAQFSTAFAETQARKARDEAMPTPFQIAEGKRVQEEQKKRIDAENAAAYEAGLGGRVMTQAEIEETTKAREAYQGEEATKLNTYGVEPQDAKERQEFNTYAQRNLLAGYGDINTPENYKNWRIETNTPVKASYAAAAPAYNPMAQEPLAPTGPARLGMAAYEDVGQLSGIENAPTNQAELDSFNDFTNKPEYAETSDIDAVIAAWRQSLGAATGSGKKRKSYLVEYVARHSLKRPRESYDERFFG
jgi:hypothetical protein